ncbi:hypothetical protein XELAEV_18005310mg [Xenopus laevis]|uniref:Uncharacterized protein n=1 Tax=Xenopus laevis TaxID=8355 RepID=A0A974I2I1_XENLA|nr:hypothetical protein XELAEV_18005310mg [Xenopus laevis]
MHTPPHHIHLVQYNLPPLRLYFYKVSQTVPLPYLLTNLLPDSLQSYAVYNSAARDVSFIANTHVEAAYLTESTWGINHIRCTKH